MVNEKAMRTVCNSILSFIRDEVEPKRLAELNGNLVRGEWYDDLVERICIWYATLVETSGFEDELSPTASKLDMHARHRARSKRSYSLFPQEKEIEKEIERKKVYKERKTEKETEKENPYVVGYGDLGRSPRSQELGVTAMNPTSTASRSSTVNNPNYSDWRADADFVKFKQAYPKRSGGDDWKPAYKIWLRILKQGHPARAIIAGARRYHEYLEATQKLDTVFVRMATTFLNQESWLRAWDYEAPEFIKRPARQFFEDKPLPPSASEILSRDSSRNRS